MEKNMKINSNSLFTLANDTRFKVTNKNSLKKNMVKEKSFLPPINNNTITKKCPFCENLIQKVIFMSHYDSHPSKILDYLYLGSFANALNNKVRS